MIGIIIYLVGVVFFIYWFGALFYNIERSSALRLDLISFEYPKDSKGSYEWDKMERRQKWTKEKRLDTDDVYGFFCKMWTPFTWKQFVDTSSFIPDDEIGREFVEERASIAAARIAEGNADKQRRKAQKQAIKNKIKVRNRDLRNRIREKKNENSGKALSPLRFFRRTKLPGNE